MCARARDFCVWVWSIFTCLVMSSSKKLKLDPRQRRFELRNNNLLLTDGASNTTDEQDLDDGDTQRTRRGVLESWRSFTELEWKKKYPWIQARFDGIYCIYCSHGHASTRNKSGKFVTVAFTGNHPDKLAKHDSSVTHQTCASDYREFQARESSSSSIVQIINQSNTLTVDEDALCDSMKCMYWLAKHEVPNSLFCPLLDVCVLMGNTTLPMLYKAKYLNYRSEQIKAEFLTCIGSSLEEQLLENLGKSPYFSLVIDEATDISVHKQLGICVQYIDHQSANVQVDFLKLIELPQGTADVICDTVITYLTIGSLNLERLAGGATDGASVMVGSNKGVVTRIKGVVPKFISTHCSAHRLQLAACHAAESIPEVVKFQSTVNQIYVYFSRSYKQNRQTSRNGKSFTLNSSNC